MPSKSSIATLPADVLGRLNGLIGDGSLTVDALTDWLDAAGHPRSRSAVGRHRQKIDAAAADLRESREITEALAAELGEATTQGKQGRLLVEMTRSLVFKLIMKLQKMEAASDALTAFDTKDVQQIGKGLAELGRALRLDQDFEDKIRERVAAEEREKAAEAAAEAATEGGLSRDMVQTIRRRILIGDSK